MHGAWHGGWCFERVAAELERRGHESWAPDLPCDEVGLTVHDYAAVVGPQPDAVVVGHSLGGLTIPLVPARVAVFLAALVPVEHTFSVLDPEFGGTLRDERGRSYWPDVETTRSRLYPDLRRSGRGVCVRETPPAGSRRALLPAFRQGESSRS